MTLLIATVIDGGALLKTAIAAVVAGVGVPLLFATAIYGISRYSDFQRDGRRGAAAGSIALAAVSLALSIAAVVVGILVMVAD